MFDSLFSKDKNEDIAHANPDLVRAMHEVAANDNPNTRKQLYEAMLAATFWIPVREIPEGLAPGLQTTNSAMPLQLMAVADKNGVRITPAFTDEEALRNWNPITPYIGMKSRALFRAVLASDIQAIMINPFDPNGRIIVQAGE